MCSETSNKNPERFRVRESRTRDPLRLLCPLSCRQLPAMGSSLGQATHRQAAPTPLRRDLATVGSIEGIEPRGMQYR